MTHLVSLTSDQRSLGFALCVGVSISARPALNWSRSSTATTVIVVLGSSSTRSSSTWSSSGVITITNRLIIVVTLINRNINRTYNGTYHNSLGQKLQLREWRKASFFYFKNSLKTSMYLQVVLSDWIQLRQFYTDSPST